MFNYKELDRLLVVVKYGLLCNNSLKGGDCYGDSYCSDKNNDYGFGYCKYHSQFLCMKCGLLLCGCCVGGSLSHYIEKECPRCCEINWKEETSIEYEKIDFKIINKTYSLKAIKI